jgi:cytochrome c oxidase subunit III
MEIPYTVTPREDTGLYNAKLGIWLFLASEVMLFGGLFSAYILLRMSAAPDTWPQGWLNIPLGTFNTLVLITSSITTVMAWASCKLKRFDRFKVFHGLTILLACAFVAIKSYEYRDKFLHYEVRMNDEITLTDGKVLNGLVVDGATNLVVFRESKGHPGQYGEPVKFEIAKVAKVARGRTVDGHLEERTPEWVVINGHEVEDPKELVNLRHHAAVAHKEFKLVPGHIRRMQNYGPWHHNYLAIYFTLSGLHALHVIGGALVIGFLWGPGSRMWQTDPERFTNRVEVSGLFWHFVDLVWIFLFPVLYLL